MFSRTRCWAGLALVAAAAWGGGCAEQPAELRRPAAAAQLDAVKFWEVTASTRWNRRAIDLFALRPPGNAQAQTSRILSYLSIAQYRAVLAAERGKIGPMHPSVSAAVGGASVAVRSGHDGTGGDGQLSGGVTGCAARGAWPLGIGGGADRARAVRHAAIFPHQRRSDSSRPAAGFWFA